MASEAKKEIIPQIIEEVRQIMDLGDDLIQEMKEYCDYLTGFWRPLEFQKSGLDHYYC